MESTRKLLISSRILADKNILTAREIEYISLVALGYGNKIIAKTLLVTHSTVKKTLEIIFDKLKAKDRANAVTIAFIHKLLSEELLSKISQKYNLL